MKDEELLQFEDRSYVNPEISQGESLAFIDNLRNLQAQNNAQINQQTYNLGTQIPSNLGGLTGSEGTWQARYQTPQMNATVANLQNTARQTALNTALANQQAMWQNRYNQAKRALEKAQHKYNTTSNTPSGNLGFEGTGELTDASSEWEGPKSDVAGTTTIAEDEQHQWTTDNATGEVLHPEWEFASIAVNRIKKEGGRIINVVEAGKNLAQVTFIDKNGKTKTLLVNSNSAYPEWMR